jgi:glycosyltransferase involved in cell wall biosynthesis
VTFVAYRLAPASGLERATVDLVHQVAAVRPVTVIVLRGHPDTVLGPQLRHAEVITGLAALRQTRRAMRSSASLVVCGLLAAALLVVLGAGRVRRRDNATMIHWEHSLLPQRLDHDRRLGLVLRLGRRSIARSRAIVCVSAGVAEAVRQLPCSNGIPLSVVPNMVAVTERPRPTSTARPHDGDSNRVVRVLGIGSLRTLKNYELAVRALAELPPRFHLTLLGDGPERVALQRLAEQLGVEARTTFAGHVADVGCYLEHADLLVHPSRAETFGLSILEAAAYDVPVITLDVAALDEIVPRFAPGVRVQVPEPREFAAAILALSEPGSIDPSCFYLARQEREREFRAEATVAAWVGILEGARR